VLPSKFEAGFERTVHASLSSHSFPTILVGVMGKVYIVAFRARQKDHAPSKFIVFAEDMNEAIETAWQHGGPDFHAYFDKATAQAEEITRRRPIARSPTQSRREWSGLILPARFITRKTASFTARRNGVNSCPRTRPRRGAITKRRTRLPQPQNQSPPIPKNRFLKHT
jgi:hypothetical protein